MSAIDIRNFTRGPVPRLPFEKAAASVLPGWELSLVLAGEARARALNRALRNKDYAPNVLSYKVGPRSGEIILCPKVAAREAASYGHPKRAHLHFLFIHGLLHLKGLRHGATMDAYERELFARFSTALKKSNGTTNRNRH